MPRLFLTGPSFAKNVALMAELLEHGVDVRCVDWGKTFQGDPLDDDRWLVLAPKELPAFAPLPQGDYGQIDVDAPLEQQVELVLQDLRWKAM